MQIPYRKRAFRVWTSSAGNFSRPQDAGFTLIELLIVVVVIPMVIGAIASAIVVGFTDSSDISTRVSDSHDAQISSAYFVRDVESATQISTDTSPGYAVCPATPAATQILGLTWTPYDTQIQNSVSYGLNGANPPSLVRRFCSAGHEVDSIIAEDLFAGIAAPALTNVCGGASSCAVGNATTEAAVTVNSLNGEVTCSNGGFVHTYPDGHTCTDGTLNSGIGTVILSVTENQTKYQYTLTAAPREESQPAPPVPPGGSAPALLLFGSGSGVLSCFGSTHAAPVTVYGLAAVDSSSAGSVQLGTHNSLVAGDLYTQNPNTGGSGPVSGSYTGPGGSPAQYSSGPTYPDPYANLPDPNDAQLGIAQSNATSLSPVANPGDYVNPISITQSTTLKPGAYIFEKGLSISGNGHSTNTLSGTGVFIFIGVPNAGPGISQTATYSVSGNAAAQLTPMTTGPYNGIVIFQSRTDANQLTISGNGTASAYGGVIYAPDASVSTSGNGATVAGSIAANSLACGGNGGIAIGFASTQTTPTANAILIGSTNTDQATVTGDPYRGAPTGTVTFYVCGPVALPTTCSSSTGASLGSANLTTGSNNTSSATSSATPALNTTGTYCFAGYYSGDNNYGPTSDTSSDECFTVMQPLTNISFPVNGQTYGQASNGWQGNDSCAAPQAICGSSSDTAGTTVTDLQLAIQGPTGTWWNGTFTNGVANFTATNPSYVDIAASASPSLPATSASWTFNWSSSYFGSTGTYMVQVKSTDSSNHTSIQTSAFTIGA